MPWKYRTAMKAKLFTAIMLLPTQPPAIWAWNSRQGLVRRFSLCRRGCILISTTNGGTWDGAFKGYEGNAGHTIKSTSRLDKLQNWRSCCCLGADRKSALEADGHISSWDVSAVTSMVGMFEDTDLFNISSVDKMYWMFNRASTFYQNDSSWNVSGVIEVKGMFNRASAFNQNLCAWGRKLLSTRNNEYSMPYMTCST